MSRTPATVRDALPDDAVELSRLWVEAGHHNVDLGEVDKVREVLAGRMLDPRERLLVAVCKDRIVGALHVRRAAISPLHTEEVVHTSFLMVLPDHRRHGIAHLLLEAAASWADVCGIEHVTAIADSSLRDANRFFARLGLGMTANIRVASTTSLRKRLGAERRQAGRQQLGAVIAQRRSLRRREQGARS